MASEFGTRIRPEEITPSVRLHLVNALAKREHVALNSVAVPATLIVLTIVIICWATGETLGTTVRLLGPILVTLLAILGVIHMHCRGEKKFLRTAEVAAAEVKEIESVPQPLCAPRIIVKFRPIAAEPTGASLKLQGATMKILNLSSTLPGFNKELHRGDWLTILYDPANPDHAVAVEEEHAIQPVFQPEKIAANRAPVVHASGGAPRK